MDVMVTPKSLNLFSRSEAPLKEKDNMTDFGELPSGLRAQVTLSPGTVWVTQRSHMFNCCSSLERISFTGNSRMVWGTIPSLHLSCIFLVHYLKYVSNPLRCRCRS
jgi:hypothetical protein